MFLYESANMTGLRELLIAFRIRRTQEFSNSSDSMSFQSFKNSGFEKRVYEKESSLTNNSATFSPIKLVRKE